jgi:hypothetical protein
MGVTARLLIHKNGPAGLLVEVEKVKVRMAWTVYHLVLTLEYEVPRQEAYAGIINVPKRSAVCQKEECNEMTVTSADDHWER